jgi:hypothetical protein
MLRELGAAADATVVVDAGIGIEKNLVALREAGFHYICVGRGKPLEEADDTDEGMVLIKARAENVVRGKLVKGQGEWILRCESSQRRVKEQAMKERFRQRFEEGLTEIRASLGKKRGTKSYEKVLERLGRLKERSHGIHRYYEITLIHDQRTVSELRWNYSRAAEADERYAGRYYIRTSRTDLDEKSLWQLYVTLGGIEDSFRSLKGELGLRPVFHSKSTRIKAHLFITVLAYHCAEYGPSSPARTRLPCALVDDPPEALHARDEHHLHENRKGNLDQHPHGQHPGGRAARHLPRPGPAAIPAASKAQRSMKM